MFLLMSSFFFILVKILCIIFALFEMVPGTALAGLRLYTVKNDFKLFLSRLCAGIVGVYLWTTSHRQRS